jgi:arabinose-5-phosphate isomerase
MESNKHKKIREILELESKSILDIPISDTILEVVDIIVKCKGKLVASGIGKAGNIAQKVSSSFSSTGTPSIFLHPSEAQHGDLGMLSKDDVLLVFSNSGKTREILELIELSKNLFSEITIISICSDIESELAKLSDLTLSYGKTIESCRLNLAPTSSAIAMLALCDVLVVLTMEEKNFTKDDFFKRHHGGYLGTKKNK